MSLLDNASLLLTPNAYKEGKLYSVIPSNGNGDFTATRATTATRVNSAGLVDLVPYNLVQYSEQFDSATWGKFQTNITANTTISPSGVIDADTLTADGTTNFHDFGQIISVTSGITYTLSIYAKKNTNNFIQISGNNSAFSTGFANFDLNNGVVGTIGAGASASITNVGNGWYRCSVTMAAIATISTYAFRVGLITSATSIKLESNTLTTSVFLWGAQLVEGTSARDYLRTETRLNIPRVDYSLGGCPNILLEPQRTNSVLNSSMVGAVAGSPGTAPTGWAFNGGGGLTRTISLGTENGLPYIDFRFQGTAIQTFLTILPTPSSTSASATQNWNFSLYAKLVSGTLPSPRLNILASGGTAQTQVITLTSSLQRFDTTFLNLPVGTTNVRPYLDSNTLSIGTAYDFTIRIAAPQMEQGAYATSYIPTTTASVTRNADSLTRNNIFTNGLITASGGTWFVELRNNVAYVRDGFGALYFGTQLMTTGTNGDGFFFRRNDANSNRLVIQKYTNGIANQMYTTLTDNIKVAIKWNGSTADVFVNGVKVVTASSFTATQLEFLGHTTTGDVPKFIQQTALFPTPLTDAQCIALTQ